ncbi:PREDICTED: cytochrome P450 78A1-like [Nicotiana attenuata]|uniref:cytochrome P450 78A1-like n=1 Tax=Nicotiana attenuata TaxID=49451 RepID=UPI0009059C80|nr:PREDICTED: cytochrome P450 78A1-like [Nicotiana attenuata]
MVSDNADFVDVLSSLDGEEKQQEDDMVVVLWEMIFIGTDTTTLLSEWVMAELILNSDVQKKLQKEVDNVTMGKTVTDADVTQMSGGDLRLAPFEAGRRVCLGKNLGLVTVMLWVAKLVQNFKWVEDGFHAVNLEEVLKLSCEMKNPLIAVAIHRNVSF